MPRGIGNVKGYWQKIARTDRSPSLHGLVAHRLVVVPMTVRSGPPQPELPHRWGCVCGAVWNCDQPVQPTGPLCGPFCKPQLTELPKVKRA